MTYTIPGMRKATWAHALEYPTPRAYHAGEVYERLASCNGGKHSQGGQQFLGGPSHHGCGCTPPNSTAVGPSGPCNTCGNERGRHKPQPPYASTATLLRSGIGREVMVSSGLSTSSFPGGPTQNDDDQPGLDHGNPTPSALACPYPGGGCVADVELNGEAVKRYGSSRGLWVNKVTFTCTYRECDFFSLPKTIGPKTIYEIAERQSTDITFFTDHLEIPPQRRSPIGSIKIEARAEYHSAADGDHGLSEWWTHWEENGMGWTFDFCGVKFHGLGFLGYVEGVPDNIGNYKGLLEDTSRTMLLRWECCDTLPPPWDMPYYDKMTTPNDDYVETICDGNADSFGMRVPPKK